MRTLHTLLSFLAGRGLLPEERLRQQLETDVYADGARWRMVLRLLLLGLGFGFLACAIVFFFAYNWAELPKFTKIGLAAAGVAVPVLLGIYGGFPELVRKGFFTAGAFLVGGLFAVLGQIYQTGANAYDLFLAWTIFIVLWVLVVDFAPLWLLFLGLLNLTLTLYADQVAAEWPEWVVPFIQLLLNGGAFVALRFVGTRWRERAYPVWLLRVLALAAVGAGTVAFVSGLHDGYRGLPEMVPVVLVPVLLAGAAWLAYGRRELTYLAMLALAGIGMGTALILFLDDDIGGFFFSAVWVLGATTLFIRKLMVWRGRWMQGEAEEQAPETPDRARAREFLAELLPEATDREAVLRQYRAAEEARPSLSLRLLALLGGLLSVLSLSGLLFLLEALNSETSFLFIGGLMLAVAWYLDRYADANFTQALVVALVACGGIYLVIGCGLLVEDDKLIAAIGTILFLVLLAVFRHPLVVFLTTLAACGCALALATFTENMFFIHAYVIVVAGLLTYWVLEESRLLSAGAYVGIRYGGILTGLMGGLLLGSFYLGNRYWWLEQLAFFGYSPLVLIPLILYVAYRNMRRLGLADKQVLVYLLGLALLLAPTYFAPAAAPALLLLLLSVTIDHRLGIALGTIALIYFLGQFYYDLKLTLLTKSMVLAVSGTLLLLAYGVLHPKLRDHAPAA